MGEISGNLGYSLHCNIDKKNYPGPDHRDWKEEAGEEPVETVL